MPNECLPKELQRPHDDWFWPLSYIPRGWTARCGKKWPMPPKLLLGNSGWTRADHYLLGHHTVEFLDKYGKVLPIPKAGHWIVTAAMYRGWVPVPMFAITWKNGDYFSFGAARWDDVDEYYDLMRIRAHGRRGRFFMWATAFAIPSICLFAIGTLYFMLSS